MIISTSSALPLPDEGTTHLIVYVPLETHSEILSMGRYVVLVVRLKHAFDHIRIVSVRPNRCVGNIVSQVFLRPERVLTFRCFGSPMAGPKELDEAPDGAGVGLGWVCVAAPCVFRMALQAVNEDDAKSSLIIPVAR